jgi:hypothetical protein
MKILGRIAFALLVLVALAFAQQLVPSYDTTQQSTLKGRVQEVKEYQCPVSGTIGSHIVLTSGSETLEVLLAPVQFLKDYGIVIKAGDAVTVTGMRFAFEGKPAMMARTVVVDRSTFTFRDNKGRPEW